MMHMLPPPFLFMHDSLLHLYCSEVWEHMQARLVMHGQLILHSCLAASCWGAVSFDAHYSLTLEPKSLSISSVRVRCSDQQCLP